MADELEGEKKGGAKKGLGAKKAPAKKAASSAKKLGGAKKLAGGAKKAGKKAAKRASSSPRAAGEVSRDDIATAAYHRWEREGGDAVENWLHAERELRGDS